MARGRKPIPTVLKVLTGNKGHYPLPENEPQPQASIPECPDHLDKGAKIEWIRITKELAPIGMLTKIDRGVLAIYCQECSSWEQSNRMVQKEGMVLVNDKGVPSINPYFKIAAEAGQRMLKAMCEMGLTPSSRARVKVNEIPKEADKLERFFN